MDFAALGAQLIKLGAPILGTAIGGPLGGAVGTVLAQTFGAADETPEAISAAVQADPQAGDKLKTLEADRSDEWLSIIKAGQELQAQLATTESSQGGFAYYWRPAMSWLIITIIAQSFLVAPWLRGLMSVDVGTPYDQVLGISAVWLTIYGGGHTLKAVLGTRLGR